MDDAVAGGHPLRAAVGDQAVVADTVPVLKPTAEHVGDRLEPAVWMLWKSRHVVCRVAAVHLVQQEEGIEHREQPATDRAAERHTRPIPARLGRHDVIDLANRAGFAGPLTCEKQRACSRYRMRNRRRSSNIRVRFGRK